MSKKLNQHIALRPNYLKAMLLTTATDNIRCYLQGVCFKAINGNVWALASDGHRIGRWFITDSYLGKDFEWIIDTNAIKQAIEWGGEIILETSYGILSISDESGRISLCRIIDGIYPNALKTINDWIETPNNEAANPQFQAKYIKDLAKITKLLSKGIAIAPRFTHVTRQSKGGNVFIVDGAPDYIHIIMPLTGLIEEKDKQKLNIAQQKALMLADLTNPVHKLLDEGKFVKCGVSNKTTNTAYKNADGTCVRNIVAYDEIGYMDDHCDVWQFAHLVEVVEDNEAGFKDKEGGS